ncbi:MAG: peptide chain release factor N(5)-glutamine methyltransferase [Armatimonadota bacterium]|nr:peptide chain release factor N(5)-glutamine methyltransferase [Armatimonadota bacterium]
MTTLFHQSIEKELAWAVDRLRKAGIDTPFLDAEVLMSHVTGLSRTQLIANPKRELSQEESARFRELVGRRCERFPLPYLTGKKEFWGLEFEVNPSVLIPRPETELLVEFVIEWLGDRPAIIAEIGAGSGAISVALAKALPRAMVYATEICPDAAATATRNAKRHLVDDRVKVLLGDLAKPLLDEGLEGKVDALVSNPPYVHSEKAEDLQPEVRCEPSLATVAGPDPLLFYRRIITEGRSLLAPGGRVFFEIDPGLAEFIAEIGEQNKLRFVEMRRDLAGLERLVILECESSK